MFLFHNAIHTKTQLYATIHRVISEIQNHIKYENITAKIDENKAYKPAILEFIKIAIINKIQVIIFHWNITCHTHILIAEIKSIFHKAGKELSKKLTILEYFAITIIIQVVNINGNVKAGILDLIFFINTVDTIEPKIIHKIEKMFIPKKKIIDTESKTALNQYNQSSISFFEYFNNFAV